MSMSQADVDDLVRGALNPTGQGAVDGDPSWSHVRCLLPHADATVQGEVRSLLHDLEQSDPMLVPSSAATSVLALLFHDRAKPGGAERVECDLGRPLAEWSDKGPRTRGVDDKELYRLAVRSAATGASLLRAAMASSRPAGSLSEVLAGSGELAHPRSLDPSDEISSDPLQSAAYLGRAQAPRFLELWQAIRAGAIPPTPSPVGPAPMTDWKQSLNTEPMLRRLLPYLAVPSFAALTRRTLRQLKSKTPPASGDRDATILLMMSHAAMLPADRTWHLTKAVKTEFGGWPCLAWSTIHGLSRAVAEHNGWGQGRWFPLVQIVLESLLSRRTERLPMLKRQVDSLLMTSTPADYRPESVAIWLKRASGELAHRVGSGSE
jgi:hypothetical protein